MFGRNRFEKLYHEEFEKSSHKDFVIINLVFGYFKALSEIHPDYSYQQLFDIVAKESIFRKEDREQIAGLIRHYTTHK